MEISEEGLLKIFLVQNIIFNPKFYELAKKYDDEELLYFFDELKTNIEYNFQNKIYSKTVKQRLFTILSIYEERFKDTNKEVYNMILHLKKILNKSGEDNVEFFLLEQFCNRHMNIFSTKKLKKFNILDIENQIYCSMSKDLIFLCNLTEMDKETFIKETSSNLAMLFSLNYILISYPYIFTNKDLLDKVIGLLNYNSLSKKDIQIASKVCFQKIKKLKLDKS